MVGAVERSASLGKFLLETFLQLLEQALLNHAVQRRAILVECVVGEHARQRSFGIQRRAIGLRTLN